MLYGNMRYEQAERILRLFAERVMPRFRSSGMGFKLSHDRGYS
jgi:hypothetical protein